MLRETFNMHLEGKREREDTICFMKGESEKRDSFAMSLKANNLIDKEWLVETSERH